MDIQKVKDRFKVLGININNDLLEDIFESGSDCEFDAKEEILTVRAIE